MNIPPVCHGSEHSRRVLVAILIVAVGFGVLVGGPAYWRHRNRPTAWSDPAVTWDGVPTILQAASRSWLYNAGALQQPHGGAVRGVDAAHARAYRLAVDFLQSITPQQASVFRSHQPLPYRQLAAHQRDALTRLAATQAPGRMSGDISDSFVEVMALTDDRSRFLLAWLEPTGAPGQAGLLLQYEFPQDRGAP